MKRAEKEPLPIVMKYLAGAAGAATVGVIGLIQPAAGTADGGRRERLNGRGDSSKMSGVSMSTIDHNCV